MTDVAIIGAGLAGLTAAKGLGEKAEVRLFEKSWRAGGRMSTRTGAHEFDHGAQYFMARTSDFNTFLAPYIVFARRSRFARRIGCTTHSPGQCRRAPQKGKE